MLVRVKATVEAVGEAEELVDIRRPYRVGAVIGALMEELERAHPGVSLLEHVLTFESKPTKGKPDRTVSSGDAASKEIATPVELPASSSSRKGVATGRRISLKRGGAPQGDDPPR